MLPLLVILLLGIFQLGFLYSTHIGLINGTREGARYGATVPTQDGSTAGDVENQLYNTGTGTGQLTQATGFDGTRVTRDVTYCKYSVGSTWHVRLRATVDYLHPLFVPIVGAIFDPIDDPSTPGAFRLTVEEEMRVENPNDILEPALGTC
ncbi:MAG: pilus assembly protein [Chloroflexota bacterium]|nr:pilus assembly protein [Chloroflexota bacterium]